MGLITKDCFNADICKINFKGWGYFDDPSFKDFSDVLRELKEKSKQADYDQLLKCMNGAEFILKLRLAELGITFSGDYHQHGPFGTPIFEVVGLPPDYEELNGIYKWTCSLRYWGGIMEACGFGTSYTDWAWGNPIDGKVKTPDEIMGEQCIKCLPFKIVGTGVAADAYDPEFDKPIGD